jgi:hypothetical protein
VQTPQVESNLPGLAAIAYRTGTWATFRESMLARLSSSDYPALAALKTRASDDFSIALLDAAAVVFDILTFYQERLANESYLRTATQLYSMTQLSQLIGYQPWPGVSASTYLAFTIQAATGLPTNPATATLTIPAGTQVQSVAAQGQLPQSFETSSDILAKPDWNALPVLTGSPWLPETGATSAYLAGTSTQLNPGDAILIVGDERALDSTMSPAWDVRTVTQVQPDTTNLRTLVTWSTALGTDTIPRKNPVIYALRQRAALFGYNAINPVLLASTTLPALKQAKLVNKKPDWKFNRTSTGQRLGSQQLVDLDSVYTKLTVGGWLVLICPNGDNSESPAGDVSLYGIEQITSTTLTAYGMSGKISRITTDKRSRLNFFNKNARVTSVLTQSEALPAAEQPLDHPLYGTFLDLEIVRNDLAGVSSVAISGKSQKIMVNAGVKHLIFVPDDGTANVPLTQGVIVSIIQPPSLLNADGSMPSWRTSHTKITLRVADVNGRTGTVVCRLREFTLTSTSNSDPVVSEFALVSNVSVVGTPFPHTRILLQTPLLNCYDRTVSTVNANVGAATAGASVAELLGSGSASTPDQQFTLKQSPLTYTQSPTTTGSLSSLHVTANGVAWTAVPSLYDQASSAQVFATFNLPGGTATVEFGDGVEGATLPTGQGNIQATYRVGLGSAGNVAAGSITTLVNRPLGVSGVTNPLPATGGQDAASVQDVRTNAPLTVLTLGRAVSITDYQNFAATFAGIAKASAVWIPSGPFRGVFITVAGAGGAALPPGNPTLANLVAALKTYGNPSIAIYAQSFLESIFSLKADVLYDPKYDASSVQAAIGASLTQTYSFAQRTFEQGVSGDEIAALIQAVPGVVAVNVKKLKVVATSAAGDLAATAYSVSAYNNWMAQALLTPLPRQCAQSDLTICAYLPVPNTAGVPSPAEILVIDPDPKQIVLGVMA